MAAFGYLVYLLRVNEPRRVRELQRLSAAGDNDDDLLDLIEDNLKALGPGYQREPKTSEGFRVRELDRRNRSLFVRLNKGPEGSPGEIYNVETEESVDTTEAQAQLSGLRAFFVIPADSYYGLLFVERVGLRHLKEVMANAAIRPAGMQAGVVTRIESFAEAKDWAAELANKQALRVSELLQVSESSEDASTPSDTIVRVMTEGTGLRRASNKIKEKLTERFTSREERLDALAQASELARRRRAGKDAFTVQDERELEALTAQIAAMREPLPVDQELLETLSDLVPVDRERLRHKKFDVALGSEHAERTFTIEGDAVPQFVYQLGGRLTDRGLQDTWSAHAVSILKNRRVTLPSDWNKVAKR